MLTFFTNNINKSIKTNKSIFIMWRCVKENWYYPSESSLDSKQTDFSVHHMTSLARHFSVLTHTLELHTKNHVNILGS